MITITERAAAEVRAFVEEHAAHQFGSPGVRLLVTGGSCAGYCHELHIEAGPRPDDHTFEDRGIHIYVDPTSFPHVDGAEIDYVETKDGSGFTVAYPSQDDPWSCGSSFRG